MRRLLPAHALTDAHLYVVHVGVCACAFVMNFIAEDPTVAAVVYLLIPS